MIIENGHIHIKAKGEPVMNEDGYYLKPTESTWGVAIPCQWTQLSANNNDMVEGEHYKTASYTILIDAEVTPCVGEQLQLVGNDGVSKGEFSILSVEHLFAVGELRIGI